MKILFTGVNPALRGGLERFAERAAELLRTQGHTVDVVWRAPDELEAYDLVVMQKIPEKLSDLRRLKAACGERLRFYAHDHCIYCLRRHSYWPGRRLCTRTYSFLPCRLCAAVTRPSFLWRNLTYPLKAFLKEMRTVRAFTPSGFIKERLVASGFPADRVKCVFPLFLRVEGSVRPDGDWMPDGRLRVLFLGQLLGGKGVSVLVEALRHVSVPCTLAIAGTGPDEEKLKRQASTLPSGVKVEFLGWQPNPEPLFAASDVCVVPSLWHEPFGTVGAEALSHGVPVVTFDVGGLRDWLKPGETGFFAEDRSPRALAAALDKIADPKLLARLGAKSMEFARRTFSPERFLEEFT